MDLDEFTFPATHPTTTPIDSPPLWRLSPSASPTPSYLEATTGMKLNIKTSENGNFYSRKSCSFLEGKCLTKRSRLSGNNEDDDQAQEKMDMLWEDLNYEELFKSKRDSRLFEFHSKGSNEVMEFGCVPTPFKLVRTSTMKGGGSKIKRPSMVVLIKVLKRLFVLQQFAKKRSR
ncbi:hypothetical protein SOVF_104490 [Spinacia oleracea]|uniref:Uncharacterized protein n=1 Tax=Spinacia oleracea TaxID=3562 RepID=A0A9R0IC49_SPIOL|nr:uncharacterized protein LOC110785912 [Spinacia oleracea]KNA14695.1 hypothetical protein SOVF_104490 [Spinacia oleracea]